MKTQNKLVKNLKVAIVKFLKLVQLGVKKYIIQLADTEKALETALHSQLARLATENVYQQAERVRKLIQTVAIKNQMALGQTDTFMGVGMIIYKRVPHPREMWKDTQLGKLVIDDKGQVIVSLRYSRGLMIVPDLKTAFGKFENYYQSTVLKYT